MENIKRLRPYSFHELDQLRWKYYDPRLIGPQPPIDDPILVAGLLFVPFNSNSTRTLTSSPYRYGGLPYISIAIHHDFADSSYRILPTTRAVRERLLNEGYVEGTPRWGYTDMETLRLNKRGNKAVVSEWFTEDADVMQYLAAGAALHADGKITWS